MPRARSSANATRGETGRTYLGWRHKILLPPPGPAPRRPAPSDARTVSEEWIADQRDSEAQTNRPLYFALLGLALPAILFPALWLTRVLPGSLALGGVFACAAIAAPVAFALVQSRQVIVERLERARERLDAERAERERVLRERQREHATRYTEWQAASRAYEAQPRWYGMTVPVGTSAVVVVGGADTGWSALLTTIGVSRLREGGDLTVVDLTGHGVARELVRLTRRCAVEPRRWVLPADLPRMTLGTDLDAGQRARVLSAVAAATGRAEDVDADETLLLRLLEVLGRNVDIARLIGGLRALLTPADDDAEDDPALALLTVDERTRVRERCAGDPAVRERAWALEERLSPFEAVGTRADDAAYAQVKIISTDRASGAAAARVYGTYAVAALSELLETREPGPAVPGGRAPRVRPDRTRTVVVCGAEILPEEEVEQVLDAAEDGGVEVVLMFREAGPAAVRHLSDPSCLPVVMRQPDRNGRVARAVAEMADGFGSDQEDLEIHRLTEVIGETVGASITEPDGGDENGPAEESLFPSPHTESGALIRNAAAAISPLDLVRHVRSATAWGRATEQAAETDTDVASTEEEESTARISGLDAESLRNLPPTAALVLTSAGPVLADTNPGILTLSTATLATAEDHRNPGIGRGVGQAEGPDGPGPKAEEPRRSPIGGTRIEPPGDGARGAGPGYAPGVGNVPRTPESVTDDGADPTRVPPNLGPPPERLDWRV